MGKILLVLVILILILVVAILLNRENKNEKKEKARDKGNDRRTTKADVDEMITELRVKISQLKIEAESGIQTAHDDLKSYQQELKEAEAMREKIIKNL